MGVVFEARHRLMDTSCALKFIREDLAAQPDITARFLREARLAGRIDNPHVARVFDVNHDDHGALYMVMELVTGETLHERLRRRKHEPIEFHEAIDWMLQILDGVAAAHRLGIVHRDLKPANVMLSPSEPGRPFVKVLDFGLAKLLGECGPTGVTDPGTVLGTAEYMAPEQAFGQGDVDRRADVFSLGVIFFELLAGRRPVDGDAPAEVASAYLRGAAARLEGCVPAVDPGLAAAIHQALEPDRDDRFESAEPFRAAIRNVLAHAQRAGLDAGRSGVHRRQDGAASPTYAPTEQLPLPWPCSPPTTELPIPERDEAEVPQARRPSRTHLTIASACSIAALVATALLLWWLL
jgi:serine/threonine-protein kinase